EDSIRDCHVTGVQTCALPISTEAFTGGALAQSPVNRPAAACYNCKCGRLGVSRQSKRERDEHEKEREADGACPGRQCGSPGAGEIGRASCRERVVTSVAGDLK